MEYISKKESKGKNVSKLNEKFIENSLIELKDYFDNLFKGVDDKVILDNEQRIAILTDEDYNMIIAGAGSGKTTTMAAKVKYLVEIKRIDPNDILIVSFTNKAVNELQDKINNQFKIPVKICTFHKFGMDILKRKQQVKVIDSSYSIVKKYFDEMVVFDKYTLNQFIKFFGLYFNIPKYSLLFDNLDIFHYYKRKFTLNKNVNPLINNRIIKKKTINDEIVDSGIDLLIANFLYLNSVPYSYKVKYKNHLPTFIINSDKPIFIEIFPLLINNPNNYINKANNFFYNNLIKKKRLNCYREKINLIELYNNENILSDLKQQLLKYNVPLKEKTNSEIYYQLTKDKDIYYQEFINFCCKFIAQLKIKDIKICDIKVEDERSKLFLNLIDKLYKYYQNYLNENNLIDFEDMIGKASKVIDEIDLNYKYIIIDEYQDISKERFNLAKKVSEVSNSKITVVGDDWQAIYAFSGSEIDLFTDFVDLMGYSSKLSITNTYRNSQELIDIAGKFVMQNDKQIKKQLKSPKHLKNPVVVYCYDDTFDKIKKQNIALKEILDKLDGQILLIGRYNFERSYLLKDKDFSLQNEKIIYKNKPNLDITFLSAHSSKGLGFDNVIVLNMENDIYGFPSKVENDPLLNLLQNNQDNLLEERRLFYVSLTRTKNYVYLLTPITNPSVFVKEIINYKGVEVVNKTGYKIKN